MDSKRIIQWIALTLIVLVTAMACVRTLPGADDGTGGGEGISTDEAAATKDAQVQLTLQALLGTATAESLAMDDTEDEEPTATVTPTPTVDQAAATSLAAATTEAVPTNTPTVTPTSGPTDTPTATAAPCYAHRFAYDETIPDGTRLDPGESFQKVWRLQNVGDCQWTGGEYSLVFVSGDRMSGTTPLSISFTVQPQGYANFAINLKAPTVPGEYRGYWVLETDDGEVIGWGPDADQAFWVDIIVRGATPTP